MFVSFPLSNTPSAPLTPPNKTLPQVYEVYVAVPAKEHVCREICCNIHRRSDFNGVYVCIYMWLGVQTDSLRVCLLVCMCTSDYVCV